MVMSKRDRGNINPTAEAVAAMHLWPNRYSRQSGGSMDFWHNLAPFEQERCKELVKRIRNADQAHGIRAPRDAQQEG